MTGISVGASLGAGFGLIRRRPLSVLAWGAVLAGMQAVTLTLLAPMYGELFGRLAAMGAGGAAAAAAARDPAVTAQMLRFEALAQLTNLATLFSMCVVYCGVFRAVLRPEKTRFASLRIGAAELLLALLAVAAVIVFAIGLGLGMIPFLIVGVLAGLATHSGAAGMGLVIALYGIAALVLCVYLGLRFCFVGPMMVDDGRFHLFESWNLTQGRVGSLLGVLVGVTVLIIGIDIVLAVLVLALAAAAVGSVGGLGQIAALMHEGSGAFLGRLAPLIAVFYVFLVPILGSIAAIAGAPWARAYADLKATAADHFA
ncbi:MAG: hypothetical protein ACREEW_08115 [Caulobacteraceae bacterium]